ncbi:MAG: efflux RND transporter periplasmic adaptor subunit [Magnetococcales bacterium]|nr:efflux RND transporter periplasmic adaptor subunit [Magnetococcales bacterium]
MKILVSMLLLLCSASRLWAGEPMPVTVRPLDQVVIHPREEAPAEVRSLNDGLITAQVTATIVELAVQVGETVRQGELLIRLDPWIYRLAERRAAAELEGLRARLEAARKRAQRATNLQQQKQASDERVEQSDSEVKALAAQIRAMEVSLEEARIQSEKSLVRAPFAGVVVQRPARIGVNATPGTPLVQLVDLEAVELVVTLPTSRVESVTRALSWEFLHEKGRFPVQPRVIVPVADPATRSQEARFVFTAAKPVPGAAGRLIWSDPRPHLPPWMVTWRDNKPGLFLVQNDQARFHPLAEALEGHPVLLDPFPVGEVVISGREGLADQTPVKPLPAP